MRRTAHAASTPRRAAAAASAVLAAVLALSLVPAGAFAAETEGKAAAAASAAQADPAAENSWRYDDGALLDESEMDGVFGSAALLDDEEEPEIVDNPWTWQGDGYINPYGDIIPYAKLKGIDVSEHQGLIDWETVANDSDIDFAIIRCGYGSDYYSQDDAYWVYNVTECAKHGIPFGVYLYSYATDVDMIRSEVAHVLRLLDEVGYTPTYPIYLDLEDSSIISAGVTNAQLAEFADIFCTTLENEGYMAGVYANLNWWNTYLTDPAFNRWERWVAQYNIECNYTKSYTIWQCTSSGIVPGIEGRVDLNFDRVYRNRSYGAYYDVQPTDWVVKEGWFDYVVDTGLMEGDRDAQGRETGYFRPFDVLTRGQLATILFRYACPDEADADAADNATPFSDNVSGQYYTAAVNWAYGEGILTGYVDSSTGAPTGLVGPNDAVSRQDVATILYRYAESIGADVTVSNGALSAMPDVSQAYGYALDPLAWCVDNGIITGEPVGDANYLMPQGDTMRCQMAKMICVLVRDVL